MAADSAVGAWMLVLFSIAITVMALRIDRPWLRVIVVMVLCSTVLSRDLILGGAMRGETWGRAQAGTLTDDFQSGMMTAAELIRHTFAYPVVAAIMLGVLAVWRGKGGR